MLVELFIEEFLKNKNDVPFRNFFAKLLKFGLVNTNIYSFNHYFNCLDNLMRHQA